MSFTYRGLQATLERHIITEEEVQQHIQRLIAENPRIEAVTDRAAQLGNWKFLHHQRQPPSLKRLRTPLW